MRASLGTQFNDIKTFVKEMPPNTRMAIAYMQNGRAAFSSQLSSNGADVLKGLHVSSGFPGSNASPYFCLSDLAKNWPSHDRTARREVLMITDGVDNYDRQFNPDDPYVDAAINDSVRAGVIVYSVYWKNMGRANNTEYANNAGQSLLQIVTQATGGNSYWQGMGNPVSLQPFLQDCGAAEPSVRAQLLSAVERKAGGRIPEGGPEGSVSEGGRTAAGSRHQRGECTRGITKFCGL